MSGGVAYVLDEEPVDGVWLKNRVNLEMVELEELCDQEERAEVRAMSPTALCLYQFGGGRKASYTLGCQLKQDRQGVAEGL